MKNRLYVGNLAYETTTESLRARFDAVGEVVEVRIVTDGASGRRRGFAIVTMQTNDEARYAIELLDGTALDGSSLAVRYADRHGDE